MTSKHVYDSSEGLVLKSLRGAAALNPSLRLHAPSKSVYVAKPSLDLKVAVISGGGAGHEPAHASYTGDGMLTASVSGDIFASASSKQILTAIRFAAFTNSDGTNESATTPKRDVLAIINNYTGDRLHFGLAIEKARAAYPNMNITSVVVSDDVSLINRPSMVGARGLAGNILVCKILGAAAARGMGLDELKKLGDSVVENLASVGMGMEHCHVPGRKGYKEADDAELDPETAKLRECEIGMGLHNEPGVRKAEIESPEKLIDEMVGMVLSSKDGGFVNNGDEVVLFMNNLGGMSLLEMSALVDETLGALEKINILPIRVYSSTYMTSLNAPGFSISLLNVSRAQNSSSSVTMTIAQLLDDPTTAHSWLGARSHWPSQPINRDSLEKESEKLLQSHHPVAVQALDSLPDVKTPFSFWRQTDISPAVVTRAIESACQKVLTVENDLTMFDTIVGDGDCGETFARGATAVLASVNNVSLDVTNMSPSLLIQTLADILEENMGGTIGALFSLFFTAWSNALLLSSSTSPWPTALSSALSALSSYTPARPGDRTIIDSLSPFCTSLASGETFSAAVKAAKEGAASTRGMKAKLGRATYIGDVGTIEGAEGSVQEGHSGIPPDPGAWGVASIIEGVFEGLSVL